MKTNLLQDCACSEHGQILSLLNTSVQEPTGLCVIIRKSLTIRPVRTKIWWRVQLRLIIFRMKGGWNCGTQYSKCDGMAPEGIKEFKTLKYRLLGLLCSNTHQKAYTDETG